jgi:hypothetical protein
VSDPARRLLRLRIAIVLALVFDAMALLVLVRATPIIFTLFMFLAQPLFAAALILLASAVVTELRTRQIL